VTLTTGRLVRHRQTKEAATDMLALWDATPVLYSTQWHYLKHKLKRPNGRVGLAAVHATPLGVWSSMENFEVVV